MIAEDLLNHMIPPLNVSDSTGKASRWLEEFHLGQLPVLDDRRYQGLVTEADVLEYPNPAQVLADIPLRYADLHVRYDQHFYAVMELAIQHKVQVVPVLDDEGFYLGVVSVGDTVAAFGQLPIAVGQGSVLVMSMGERDYSLSQISRYVEENDAKILSAHVARDENDPYKIRLTLKLNTPNLGRVMATLERFGYVITAQFNGANEVGQDEQARYDALLKYLSL